MNIHEHQAKDILREFEAPVPKGVVVYNIKEIDQKIKILNTNNFVIKAQIHAGGRGKAGGIKLVKTNDDLIKEATSMLGKTLITKQTGPRGKIVKRLYIEEVSKIKKEFYLSCLVDRASAKIAFISSTEGGVDIEKVAKDNPEKIITTKIDLTNEVNETNVEKIIKIFQLDQRQKIQAKKLINSIFRLLIKKDANLIEVNPLIITKDDNLLCLDAKISFDDNALYRHPEIEVLRDLNEEEPSEITQIFMVLHDYGEIYFGCIDSNAANYDSTAAMDDGSCNYVETAVVDSTTGSLGASEIVIRSTFAGISVCSAEALVCSAGSGS